MADHLDTRIINILVELLEPFTRTAVDRQALLARAFAGTDFLKDVIWGHVSAHTFVSETAELLAKQRIGTESALWLLLQTVREDVDRAKQEQIDNLKSQIETLADPGNLRGISLFLSYARADNTDDSPFVKRLHNDLTKQGFVVWWDMKSLPNKGVPFPQEIRDAIAVSDRFVLVASENALKSAYVKDEWNHALKVGKPVNIALRQGKHEDLPPELKIYDAPDFRDDRHYVEQLDKLIRQLSQAPAPLGRLIGVPEQPTQLVSRPEDMAKLHELVICASSHLTVLEGLGGIGKSVLTGEFARANDVRRTFPDGIIWLTVGRKNEIYRLFQGLGTSLGDSLSNYPDDRMICKIRAQNVLNGKRCLIILDDVWDLAVGEAFRDLIAEIPSRLVITTRSQQINDLLGAKEHRVGLFDEAQSVDLLRQWIGYDDPDLAKVAKQLGYLPLALRLAGAAIKNGTTTADYAARCDRISRMYVGSDSSGNILEASISSSVEMVFSKDKSKALLYYTFGIFPEDVHIPQVTVLHLWKHVRPDVDAYGLEDTLSDLVNMGLVERHRDDNTITLHDLLHSYTREKLEEAKCYQKTHEVLLSAYRSDHSSWYQVTDDGYIYQHLIYHLLEAGQYDDIRSIGAQLDKFPEFTFRAPLVSTLSRYYADHEDALKAVMWSWLSNPNTKVHTAQIVDNVAVECEIKDFLKYFLTHREQALRLLMLQNIYVLWNKNEALTKELLKDLSRKITLIRPHRAINNLDTLLRCCYLLGVEDFNQLGIESRALPFIRELVQQLLTRFLLVSNSESIERVMRRVRRSLAKLLIGRILAIISVRPRNAIFSIKDLESFFPSDARRREIFTTLWLHFDRATRGDIDDIDALITFIQQLASERDNDLMTIALSSAVLVTHLFNHTLQTAQAVHKLLMNLSQICPPVTASGETVPTVWIGLAGLSFTNIGYLTVSPTEKSQLLETLIRVSDIMEKTYQGTWRFESGATVRTIWASFFIFGYISLQIPQYGAEPLKDLLRFLIERNDFERIKLIPGNLIGKLSAYGQPQATVDIIYDVLSSLKSYLAGLEQEQSSEFWNHFTDNMILHSRKHKQWVVKLVEKCNDGELPQYVKTQLLNVTQKENFEGLLMRSTFTLGSNTLKGETPILLDLFREALNMALDADNLQTWILDCSVYLANLAYGRDLFAQGDHDLAKSSGQTKTE